jgi:hypothetical protein
MISWQTKELFDALEADGPIFRKNTCGPENDLVNEWIQKSLPSARKGENLTVFLEPKIGSSYPDIVLVYWNPNVTKRWNKSRIDLSIPDLKILHSIFLQGGLSNNDISNIFPRGARNNTVERLHGSGLIHKYSGKWCVTNPKSNYAVRSIIAIEAKMIFNSKVIEQSLQNTWFANISAILVPRVAKDSKQLSLANQFGLNVLSPGGKLNRPIKSQSATSYVSWLFNEWVWKTTL